MAYYAYFYSEYVLLLNAYAVSVENAYNAYIIA